VRRPLLCRPWPNLRRNHPAAAVPTLQLPCRQVMVRRPLLCRPWPNLRRNHPAAAVPTLQLPCRQVMVRRPLLCRPWQNLGRKHLHCVRQHHHSQQQHQPCSLRFFQGPCPNLRRSHLRHVTQAAATPPPAGAPPPAAAPALQRAGRQLLARRPLLSHLSWVRQAAAAPPPASSPLPAAAPALRRAGRQLLARRPLLSHLSRVRQAAASPPLRAAAPALQLARRQLMAGHSARSARHATLLEARRNRLHASSMTPSRQPERQSPARSLILKKLRDKPSALGLPSDEYHHACSHRGRRRRIAENGTVDQLSTKLEAAHAASSGTTSKAAALYQSLTSVMPTDVYYQARSQMSHEQLST